MRVDASITMAALALFLSPGMAVGEIPKRHYEMTLSDSEHVAWAILRAAGYASADDGIWLDHPKRDPVPGFQTIFAQDGAQMIWAISINRATGQAFDFSRCIKFEFPEIAQEELRIGFARRPDFDLTKSEKIDLGRGKEYCELSFRVYKRRRDLRGEH